MGERLAQEAVLNNIKKPLVPVISSFISDITEHLNLCHKNGYSISEESFISC